VGETAEEEMGGGRGIGGGWPEEEVTEVKGKYKMGYSNLAT